MKQIITLLTCDVCGGSSSVLEGKQIQVVFTTEQTEGRGCLPYLSLQKIDICSICIDKVLNGNGLFGHGAQGHNHYKFKEDK